MYETDFFGRGVLVIVDNFLCWVQTAKTSDRIRAAGALGRAYRMCGKGTHERRAAEMGMSYLLDDPSPQVRLALAEVFATSQDAPRTLILPLTEDQPEIACTVVLLSPVLTDSDLVDIAAKGGSLMRTVIASRGVVSAPLAAAIVEIGQADEVTQLLQNPNAKLTPATLHRIVKRHGDNHTIRGLLLERRDLPPQARHDLIEKVSGLLVGSGLVQKTMGAGRAERVTRDAARSAAVIVAGDTRDEDARSLATYLRDNDGLTPSFLMHVLCAGQAEFFAEALTALCDLAPRRVRSILAEGRPHSLRALMESAGLTRDISGLFAETVLLWRDQAAGGAADEPVAMQLVRKAKGRDGNSDAANTLIEIAERIGIAEMRNFARQYASSVTARAA